MALYFRFQALTKGGIYCSAESLSKDVLIARLKKLGDVAGKQRVETSREDEEKQDGGQRKRRKAEEKQAEEPALRTQELSAGFQALTQGGVCCSVESLSKEVLIARLKELGDVEEVSTMEIHVGTLSAAAFDVTLEAKDSSVAKLKKAIEAKQGARDYLQDLYRVTKSKGKKKEREGGSSSSEEAVKVTPHRDV